MQVIQKIFIDLQEMIDQNKVKTGTFWFQGKKYEIKNGIIKTTENESQEIRPEINNM